MKTLDPGLAGHLAGGVTTLCRCWRVERRDGVVLGFTDHDRDLVVDGVTYRAASGFTASAIEDQLGLAVSNLDVQGALSSAAITEADLNAGRYDDASVTILLVNWQDVTQRVIMRSGFLGQVSRGTLAFTAELRGLASRLDQAAGRIFQRSCPWKLGDAHCTVNLNAAGRHGAGTVSEPIGAFEFTATGLDSLAPGTLSRGRLVWTSGANNALAVEIKSRTYRAVSPGARPDRGGRHVRRDGRLRQDVRDVPRPLRQRGQFRRFPAHARQRLRAILSGPRQRQ